MPLAAAIIPAVTAIVGGIIANKGASSARKAEQKAQDAAIQREEAKELEQRKRGQSNWRAYEDAYRNWHSRYGDAGIQRYGVPVGIDLSRPGRGRPGAPGGPGAPGAPSAPVTLPGGQQVSGEEYGRYVAGREARRGGGAPVPGPAAFGGQPPPPPTTSATIGDMMAVAPRPAKTVAYQRRGF